jgi:hypothetical protein
VPVSATCSTGTPSRSACRTIRCQSTSATGTPSESTLRRFPAALSHGMRTGPRFHGAGVAAIRDHLSKTVAKLDELRLKFPHYFA